MSGSSSALRDQLGVALRCAVSLGDFVEGLDDPVAVKDVYNGQVGVEAAAYVHVEKNAGLNCGRVGPVDGGLDVGHDSGIGHKLGEVASDGSDGSRRAEN